MPLSGRADIQLVAVGAAIVLWIALIAEHISARHQSRIHETTVEVGRLRESAEVTGILKAAGGGAIVTAPAPHGTIRHVPAEIDGEHIIVGVDEDAELADVIDLTDALRRSRP